MTDTTSVLAASHLTESSRQIARFGAFELDLRTAELRRDGVRIKLQEQPFRLLTVLVESAGGIVTREELQQKLWPDEFVDFDHSLNAAIRKLRAALDDSAENPRFVETIARRGYRFIAPVSWIATSAGVVVHRNGSMRTAAMAALIALLVIASIAYLFVRQRPTARPEVAAIAVLPFTIDDARNEHLSDGLTEILIDNISRLPNLRVMARTTVFRYKRNADPQTIARDLRVGATVTGTIRRERDQNVIRVELIDVRDGTQIWGDQFRGSDADLPALQNQIAEEVSAQLRYGIDRTRLARGSTADPRAYEQYLRGLYAWNKRDDENLKRALEYFKRAVELDPTFASAYAGIANVYGVLVGYGHLTPQEGTPKILAAAGHALQLDPNNAEALTSIATTKFRNLWDFKGAERDYRHAIASNPNYATAHQWYADYLRSMGRFAEARRENETALRLDPFSGPANNTMCCTYYYERRYDEAVAFSRKAGEIDKDLTPTMCRISSLFAKGDSEGAIRELMLSPPPKSTHLKYLSADWVEAYRKGGTDGYNRAWLAYLLRQPNVETSSPVQIASAYALLRDRDNAFAWLEKAYAHRVSQLANLNIDPVFDSLRSDPRYDDLLRRMGLPKIHIPPTSRAN